MDWIKEFFTKGWPMLMDAPFPFIVMFVLGLLSCKLYYHRQISLCRAAMGFTEEQRLKVVIEKYLKKFPPKKFENKNGFELIWNGAGAIFIHDFKTNLKHHIANPTTMQDLRLYGRNIRIVSDGELHKIKNGDLIITRD